MYCNETSSRSWLCLIPNNEKYYFYTVQYWRWGCNKTATFSLLWCECCPVFMVILTNIGNFYLLITYLNFKNHLYKNLETITKYLQHFDRLIIVWNHTFMTNKNSSFYLCLHSIIKKLATLQIFFQVFHHVIKNKRLSFFFSLSTEFSYI